MKTLTTKLFIGIFLCGLNIFSYGQMYQLSLSAGVPFANSKFNKYEVEILGKRKIFNNFFAGVGCNYSEIDAPKSCLEYFIFDRKQFNSFIALQYMVNLSEKIVILPVFNAGYAFVNYKLSGFDTDTQHTKGFSLKPGIKLAYKLNKKLSFEVFYSYLKIYSKFEKTNLIAPNPFADTKIQNHSFGISFTFNLFPINILS